MAQLPSKEIAALARVTAPVAPHMKQGFEDIPVTVWCSAPRTAGPSSLSPPGSAKFVSFVYRFC